MIEFRRKLGRPWLVVLSVLAVACMAGVAGCGGDDDDDDEYDFNGTWAQSLVVVQSNIPELPVGATVEEIEYITQSGTNITIASPDMPTMTGTCDPSNGTYSVTVSQDGAVLSESGTRVDEDTMSGEYTAAEGPVLVRMTFTSQLISRSRSIETSGPKNSLKAAVLR